VLWYTYGLPINKNLDNGHSLVYSMPITIKQGADMCEYCAEEKTIMEKEFLDDWIFQWQKGPIEKSSIDYSCYKIFIDRGYLRFVDADDCQCMDHGDSIKINFCPICGDKL
jgi:hypothetical protein